MTNDIDPEMEEKIKDWAKKDKIAKRYLSNFPLIQGLYVNTNVAKRVKDCLPNCKAELDLLILDEYEPRIVKLCSGCGRKVCKDECGKNDYEDSEARAYMGADIHYEGDVPEDARMKIEISPWNKSCKEVSPAISDVYRVTGFIRSREVGEKTYVGIDPRKMELIEDDGSEPEQSDTEPEQDDESDDGKIRDTIKHLIKSFNGSIGAKRWDAMLGDFSPSRVSDIATGEFKMKLRRGEDGEMAWIVKA